jgi:DNA-binding MarR family transcriptional regulator
MGCKACGKQEGLTSEQQSLLAALAKTAAPASKELATLSGLDGTVVSCGLKSLKDKGYVDSPARCRYAITATGRAALQS